MNTTSITTTKRTGKEMPVTILENQHLNGTTRKILLFCGILSSLWYVAINIIAPLHFPGYSIASQTVSELSAINAPSRQLWLLLCAPYSMLIMAFSWGVWLSANENKQLRILGALMLVYGISGFLWPFAPMHLRGAQFTLTDTMHIVFGIITVVLMLLMLGFGAAAFGRRFRIYCIASMVVFILFGTLTGLDGPRIAENMPTPWVGVWERINIGVFMLWMIVLAIVLWRRETSAGLINEKDV